MNTTSYIIVYAILISSLILLAYMVKVEADRREAERALVWRRTYERMKRLEETDGKIEWK